MPKWAIDAIAAIAGIAVGAGVAVAAGPGATDTCSDELEVVRAEHAALGLQVEEVTARAAQLRSDVASVEGPTLRWPSGLPEVETEAGFTKALDEALASVANAERLGLDCGEYPCIAVVRFGAGADGKKDFAKLEGALQDAGFDGYQTLSGGTKLADPFPNGDERDITVFALVPPEGSRPEGTSQRVGLRINQHVKRTIQRAMSGGAE